MKSLEVNQSPEERDEAEGKAAWPILRQLEFAKTFYAPY